MDGVRHHRMPEQRDSVHSQRFHSESCKYQNWSKSPKERSLAALFQQNQSESPGKYSKDLAVKKSREITPYMSTMAVYDPFSRWI